jgi:hypothetical protein
MNSVLKLFTVAEFEIATVIESQYCDIDEDLCMRPLSLILCSQAILLGFKYLIHASKNYVCIHQHSSKSKSSRSKRCELGPMYIHPVKAKRFAKFSPLNLFFKLCMPDKPTKNRVQPISHRALHAEISIAVCRFPPQRRFHATSQLDAVRNHNM